MPMEAIHCGVDGWRAHYDEGFCEENVARIADAAGRLLSEARPGAAVVVGFDTRRDGEALARTTAEILAAHGLRALLSTQPCPQAALSWFAARHDEVAGALMVTGGHASSDANGVRLRMADGGACDRAFYDALEAAVPPEPPAARAACESVDVVTPYLDDLISLVDADALRSSGLTIVHDPMYGTSRGLLARALGRLGVTVTEVRGEADPLFGGIRPDPIEPWVSDCQRAVVERGASLGLANDTNAARTGAVDESGLYVSIHKIAALLLDLLVGYRRQTGRVVITTPGSVLVRRQAARLGCPLTVAPVGFPRVYAEMRRGDVLLGGEETGGISIPSHLCERDGLLVDLLLCELVARSHKPLGTLVAELEDRVGHMDYGRRDLQLDPASLQMFRNMLPGLNPQSVAGMRPVDVDHTDGLRLGFADDAWLLLRPSGSEQLVRVYAEASTLLERDALLDAGCAIARGDF